MVHSHSKSFDKLVLFCNNSLSTVSRICLLNTFFFWHIFNLVVILNIFSAKCCSAYRGWDWQSRLLHFTLTILTTTWPLRSSRQVLSLTGLADADQRGGLLHVVPQLWNSLLRHDCLCQSLHTFRRCMKTQLCRWAFNITPWLSFYSFSPVQFILLF